MWTHMVRLNPDLPPTRDDYDTFDGMNVYTVREGEYLRAVGCALKAPGQKVARWDADMREWLGRSGEVLDVFAKPHHAQGAIKPHVTTSWATDTEGGKTMCLPYRVRWGKDGQPVTVERVPIESQVVRVTYK